MNIYDIIYTPVFFLVLYIVIINGYGFVVMGIDKWKAAKGKYRVPEKAMFAIALIGGGAGIYGGMKFFHHKTLHNKFKYGIPAILIVNIICIVYILYML